MKIESRKNKTSTVLEISGSLTAPNSMDLKKSFQEALNGTSNLVLVLKNVKEVDLTFIQLLASAVKTAHGESKELELKLPVPDLVAESIIETGLPNHGTCLNEKCPWCQVQYPDSRSGTNG